MLGHHLPGRRNNDGTSSESKEMETGEKVRRYHSGKRDHTHSVSYFLTLGTEALLGAKQH